MAMTEEDIRSVYDGLLSHAAASGYFDRVNQHEPKAALGYGLSAALWQQYMGPVPFGSGLRSTTGKLTFNLRIYGNMIQEPQDEIDPNLTNAANALFIAYSSDFTLDGLIRNIDLLGATGQPLESNAGYVTLGTKMFRVMTLNIPCIINDMWDQAP